jgi:hypothetical protein
MMEAAHTSETSVDIQLRTRQYIPEDSELHVISGLPNQLLYNTGTNLDYGTGVAKVAWTRNSNYFFHHSINCAGTYNFLLQA